MYRQCWCARSQRPNLTPIVALLVVGFLTAIVPLAYASPPDPTWIAWGPGIYDNADFDDVILLIVSADATASPAAPFIVVSEANVLELRQVRPVVRENRPRLTVDRSPPLLSA